MKQKRNAKWHKILFSAVRCFPCDMTIQSLKFKNKNNTMCYFDSVRMRKKSRICIVGECIKHASFGIDKKALCCSSHKSDGMENIKNVRCGVDECKKQPNYGFPEDIKATRCVNHKNERMENITSVRCGVDDCKTIPYYGFPEDITATRCVNHKDERM